MNALFGPAGTPQEFYDRGLKSALQMPGFLEDCGLDWLEYQCGRGVNISQATAKALGAKAAEHGIGLSVHTPYYISLSSVDEAKRLKSVDYIMQSAAAAKAMSAQRLVVHSGSAKALERSEALRLATDTLQRAREALDEGGYEGIVMCPETMGKQNQLGDADEVAALCETDERLIPAIDFGHLNARGMGSLKTERDFADVLEMYISRLGLERMRHFHCHFSKIKYSAGGESCHLTFDDDEFGPAYEPFLLAVTKLDLCPIVICESAGTQAKDAGIMKNYYMTLLSGRERE